MSNYEKMKLKWKEAVETGKPISIENIVMCDICNKDFTNLSDSGGFIFESYSYCPECAKKGLQRIKYCGEEKYIKEFCPDEMSFADFIRKYRGSNNFIQIIKS